MPRPRNRLFHIKTSGTRPYKFIGPGVEARAWPRVYKKKKKLRNFFSQEAANLELEATTHRMESSLDCPSIPGLRYLRLASEDWQQQASLKPDL